MDNTYEVVDYLGSQYLIPELELLFLDKFLRQETTFRSEGIDAKALMMAYKLDLDKIIDYFNKYYLVPNVNNYNEYLKNAYDAQVESFNGKFLDYVIMLLEEDEKEVNLDNINSLANSIITHELSLNPHYGYGINFSACPNKVEYVDNNGVIEISDDDLNNIKDLIEKIRKDKSNYYDSLLNEIINMYNSIYDDKKTK